MEEQDKSLQDLHWSRRAKRVAVDCSFDNVLPTKRAALECYISHVLSEEESCSSGQDEDTYL
ncbi:unnamed protein product [Clavelina lepadiformis]|uniref:Uncharacterized protein n=1 Tax=Clavelina lepadiformis TaxID=159417 RepID=A0ABP0FR90_CLALP